MDVMGMEKAFNPASFEGRIYQMWREAGVFQPDETALASGRKPFVIVIPPPNVTGVLHIGHGLNNSLQDILTRYNRMKGAPTLWLPGTDHAGIATQNVVEKILRSRGVEWRELGREKFIEETWKVKEKHHSIILEQLMKIGASCDWERERFTLDEGCSRAVRRAFVQLYNSGQIYRGDYLVNWCISCGTALSDEEVEHYERPGKLYRYRYPFVDGTGEMVIATTRPETMLGDTALAVNPEDRRYMDYVGKEVELPLTERRIPVVADSYVDIEFGTGVLKVTPAHHPNDWEMGRRLGLEAIGIFNKDGTTNDNVPERFRGLSPKECRKAVVEALKEEGYFIDEKEHPHQVGHCYRCGTVIEPLISRQWFVKMGSLAEKALASWKKGDVVFYPKHWENTYKHWLSEIRDWCVSRQLWWGHRIPVWQCTSCGGEFALESEPDRCPKCGGKELQQDEDVLDTWFSSWLWPFSTMGWPEDTPDMNNYFPTSILISGYDILFFWIARMVMASEEFLGKAPFKKVYVTGLVRDKQGRKMSKSLGNGIDPLEIVEKYGADALKFTFAHTVNQGQDVLIDRDDFKLGSRFANKIWNASRYILLNIEALEEQPIDSITLHRVDLWILHRLNRTIHHVETSLEACRFNDAAQGCYEFFWNDFCDWYIEASKLSIYSDDESERQRGLSLLLHILEYSLRLMHPLLSFITEEIYQKLPGKRGVLAVERFPEWKKEWDAPEEEKLFSHLQELVRGVRTLRSEFTIPPDRKIPVCVKVDPDFDGEEYFVEHNALLSKLMGCNTLEFSRETPSAEGSIPVAGVGFEAYVYIREAVDVPREISKLQSDVQKLDKLITQSEKKLSNPSFTDKAPDEVVEKERMKLDEFTGKLRKTRHYLEELQK